ncbi:MAG: cytidine deaminase [Leptospiraceae bacterium]|nr:cytidine deaminase [Leptospiraceae bacterium]
MNVPENLKAAAIQATTQAYSPYSKIKVGAALIDHDGNIFTGANIENASYGLTICAERVALANALMKWQDRSRPLFSQMVITNSTGTPMPPCGACRQMLLEMNENAEIFFETAGGWTSALAKDLLPGAFYMREDLAEENG